MAIPLIGKIVITVVTLGVIAGMSVVITFYVQSLNETVDVDPTESTTTTTTSTTTTTTTTENPNDGIFRAGVGIADMTGPCVEINFMGYVDLTQSGQGIHLRQFSRAFVFVKGYTRVVLVSTEVLAVGFGVRRAVVNRLQELYGDIYTLENVILTGTHTHSTPGGHLVDFLYDLTVLGFSEETFNAYVDGITRSIVRAHENLQPAQMFLAEGEVLEANMNRSPFAYNNNPAEELNRYDSNTDKILTQLRIVKTNGELHGVMNWYPVHGINMNMTNRLVSSDNLGYAALLMENALNPGTLPGKADIVTAFFPSNLGDVSPFIRDARCLNSGNVCDNVVLFCEPNEECYSSGEEDMFDSTRYTATVIYEGAMEVLNSPGEELSDNLAIAHQFFDVPEQVVSRYDTVTRTFDSAEQVQGCVPALGNFLDMLDGSDLIDNLPINIPDLVDAISVISEPTEEDIVCHAPKPILLATGRATFPYQWSPEIVSATIIWVGDLMIAGMPGEPTTMAGRRIKDVVGGVMEQNGVEPKIVVSALTNEYIQYVTTFEEYQIQRYEAASTMFGPYTLDIFLNKFAELTSIAVQGSTVPFSPAPQDDSDNTFSLISPVFSDLAPEGFSFGDVLEQPPAVVQRGDTISVTFVAANPRNDLRQEDSHATIERYDGGTWVVVATDAHWNTKFQWERISVLFATSNASFEWTIPDDAVSGTYRVMYYGAAKRLIGTLIPFTGTSNSFIISE